MNSLSRFGKPALALLLALGVAAPLVAIAKEEGCKPGHHRMSERGASLGHLNKLAKKLDLSDEQKVQFEALRAEIKAEREADKGQMKAQREAFHSLVAANASEAELKAQADQMAQSMSDKLVQSSLHQQTFRAMLTVEQREKMDAMKAAHREKREQNKAKAS